MKALNDCSTKDFMPTDEELLQNFLYNKINNEPIPNYLNILEHDLFGTEKTPLDIRNEFEASHSYSGKDLYFFTTLKKKSTTSTRSVRTIGNGNWEGEDTGKNIFAKDTNQLLGLKKCLVLHYFLFTVSALYCFLLHDGTSVADICQESLWFI